MQRIGKTRPPAAAAPGPARGVLNQRLSARHFEHLRQAPPPALAPWVEHFWYVGWALPGALVERQETLPHPNAHLVFEGGQARVWGPHRQRFSKTLAGHGWVFGVKFRAAALQPFWGRPMEQLRDRSVAAGEVWAAADTWLDPGAWPGMAVMCERAEALLMPSLPAADERVWLLNELVARAATDCRLTRAQDLAQLAGVSPRQLQRLFAHYVGVSPKWIIARYRLHEALALLQRGEAQPDAELALRLGYFDQAHFVRDFQRMVGQPPAAYVRSQVAPD
ncbi:AraC family transcriptional regulator [Pseudomonas sp. Fl4BN1]|uniref:AraC family transcriptional regulator n=1 Tax=Pseudomonas sp. Fl4BN1 TaxID=2697651 RepID=UPI001378A125|nr:helix-turn-helix domain-containing protein [Pseudomonas sp. Fl4BN1]NBF11649.1 helix-turn-helix domain-containing protein [Pseudomonas sp. Fl4BN1]